MKLKLWVKVVLAVLIAVGVGFGANALGWFDGSGGGSKTKTTKTTSTKKDKNTIVLGTNTFVGFGPYLWLNHGTEPNEDCPLYKEYGIKLKIVIQDDFPAGRAAFLNGDIDAIYCTADSWPVECGSGSEMMNAGAVFFNISNWSRGADAIVVKPNIKKVADLRGKTIATSKGTASHSLLLNVLETSEVKADDITIYEVESGVDAAQVFRAGKVDACVCYSPDDADLEAAGLGKVLVSTKQASNIICDGLVAKKDYLEKNKEKVTKLIAALLWANTKMTDPNAVRETAKYFARAYDTDEAFFIDGSKNVYYVTLGDEANFFGLDASFTGITGQELYSKMARTYSSPALGRVRAPLSWGKVSTSEIIEGLMGEYNNLVKGNQDAETVHTFSRVTPAMETTAAISNKKLTIEFQTGSDILDHNAKNLIDREFVDIAKQFSGARIRIEGNTDNTGSDAVNRPLSKRRAEAVKNYLVSEYGFDPNRFVVVGNGSAHAIAAGSTGADQRYRTTDFQLIAE